MVSNNDSYKHHFKHNRFLSLTFPVQTKEHCTIIQIFLFTDDFICYDNIPSKQLSITADGDAVYNEIAKRAADRVCSTVR